MKRILIIVALFHGMLSMISAQVLSYEIREEKVGYVAGINDVKGKIFGREISEVKYSNSEEQCNYYLTSLAFGVLHQRGPITTWMISYIGTSPLQKLRNNVINGQNKVNIKIHLKGKNENITTNADIEYTIISSAFSRETRIGTFLITSIGSKMSTNKRKASDAYEHVSYVFRLLCLHDIERIEIETKPGEMSSVRFDKIKTSPTYKAMALDLEKKTGKLNYFKLPSGTEVPNTKQSQNITKPTQIITIETKQKFENKNDNDNINSFSIRRKEHLVKRGETLESIAKKYGVSQGNILEANPGINKAYAGTTLKIPSLKTTYIRRNASTAQQEGKNEYPEMKFDSLNYNVGTIDWDKKKHVVISYKFINVGDADLYIKQVLGGDYINFMYPKSPIPPNGKGEIVVMYNLKMSYDEHLCNRPNGPFKKGFTVRSNEEREIRRLFFNGIIKNSNYNK